MRTTITTGRPDELRRFDTVCDVGSGRSYIVVRVVDSRTFEISAAKTAFLAAWVVSAWRRLSGAVIAARCYASASAWRIYFARAVDVLAVVFVLGVVALLVLDLIFSGSFTNPPPREVTLDLYKWGCTDWTLDKAGELECAQWSQRNENRGPRT